VQLSCTNRQYVYHSPLYLYEVAEKKFEHVLLLWQKFVVLGVLGCECRCTLIPTDHSRIGILGSDEGVLDFDKLTYLFEVLLRYFDRRLSRSSALFLCNLSFMLIRMIDHTYDSVCGFWLY
jgi:hypothetical protein